MYDFFRSRVSDERNTPEHTDVIFELTIFIKQDSDAEKHYSLERIKTNMSHHSKVHKFGRISPRTTEARFRSRRSVKALKKLGYKMTNSVKFKNVR